MNNARNGEDDKNQGDEKNQDIIEICKSIDEKWRKSISVCKTKSANGLLDCVGANILFTEDSDPKSVLEAALATSANNVCHLESPDIANEVQTSAIMVMDPKQFLDFPVSTILDPKRAGDLRENELASFRYHFSKASEKSSCLESFESFLNRNITSKSQVSELLSAADELYTNAVFNAPFVSLETNKNPGKDRTDSNVGMNPPFHGILFSGFLDNRLVIGCRDPFGSLQLRPLLNKIQKCYEVGVRENMNMGPGGAGIGSFLVFNAGSSYYVAVEKGQATVVSISVGINMSARKRAKLPKNLHFFEIKQEVA